MGKANDKIKVEFKPGSDDEADTMKVTLTKQLREKLSKVIVKKLSKDYDMNGTVYDRYGVKQFVGDHYTSFMWLFIKELVDEGEVTMNATYNDYLNITRELRGESFKGLLSDIENYGAKQFELVVKA